MRNLTVKLVLARWADVEDGDTVFDDDHLYRVTGDPWAAKDGIGDDWFTWPVTDTESSYDWRGASEVTHRKMDRVPVVVTP